MSEMKGRKFGQSTNQSVYIRTYKRIKLYLSEVKNTDYLGPGLRVYNSTIVEYTFIK